MKSENRIYGLPIVTYALIAANIGIFLVEQFGGITLFMWGAKINANIAQGEYWRLVTPLFFTC